MGGGETLPHTSALLLATGAVLLLALLPLASSFVPAAKPGHNSDPPALWTWINSDSSNGSQHCQWTGIQCLEGAVVGISLSNQSIDRAIPEAICDLVNLSRLDLSNNYIPGLFPAHLYNCANLHYLNLSNNLIVGNLPSDVRKLSSQLKDAVCILGNISHLDLSYNDIPGSFPTSLYSCSNLHYLDLSQNLLVGQLPADISKLSPALTYLNLAVNNFTGDIPPSIAHLPAIQYLYLNDNLFNGSFPSELGGLQMLHTLTLANNPFLPARIPAEFGNLTKLKYLWMSEMNLEGEIPETLGNLTELEHLDLAMNKLSGTIPSAIWTLEKLQYLYLYANNLSGGIGRTVKALGLVEVDVSINELTGAIPEDFGKLENLSRLIMYYNHLTGEIPSGIGLLRELYDIRLFNNNITGVLPPELGRFSMLKNLEVSNNELVGRLPDHLCDGKALFSISFFNNKLRGDILASLNSCSSLKYIQLYNNMFSGDFPTGIWSAPNLTFVIIHHNLFSGVLPDELPHNLTRLELNDNRFTGRIPSSASDLMVFKASNNLLSGGIPTNLTGISKLQSLSVGGNHISGSIPSSISTLHFLVDLDLNSNMLIGSIPTEIGYLNELISLDLSSNNLSGSIPPEMVNLKLNAFNLSYNQLSGEIPTQWQFEVYMESLLPNADLCSSKPMKKLHVCLDHPEGGRKLPKGIIILLPVLGSIVIALAVVIVFLVVREYRRKRAGNGKSWKLTSFHKLEFNVDDIVSGLEENNLVGSGGSGKVYGITLKGNTKETVAVKKICNERKLDSRLNKEFEAEVKYLSSIRHVNIVKLLCCMTNADTKLLIYEYMQNGSLDQWLHRTRRTKAAAEPLDWPKHLSVAVGAAQGLCHMHYDCSPPIIHRDIKSGNILLDSEFGAKIADFGLARMLLTAGESASVSAVAGSFGYIAPEVVSSDKISEKVDVYSFGVVLLELTTGRRATNGDESECLAEWAQQKFRQNHSMLTAAIDEELSDHFECLDEIAAVFELGLMCTNLVPSSRPSMNEVLRVLTQCHQPPATKNKLQGDFEVPPLLQVKRGSQRKSWSDAGEEDDDIIVEIV